MRWIILHTLHGLTNTSAQSRRSRRVLTAAVVVRHLVDRRSAASLLQPIRELPDEISRLTQLVVAANLPTLVAATTEIHCAQCQMRGMSPASTGSAHSESVREHLQSSVKLYIGDV